MDLSLDMPSELFEYENVSFHVEVEEDDYSILNSSFSEVFRISSIILAILGLLGNLVVILLVVINSKMKTVTNIHILNLSLFDSAIMIGLLLRHLHLWTAGRIWCKLYVVITSIADFGGCLEVAALSLDRCFAVCFIMVQMKYRTPQNSVNSCLVVWILSILVSLPMIYYGDLIQYVDSSECAVHFGGMGSAMGSRIKSIYEFTLGFLLPLILIAVSYVTILVRLRGLNFRDKNCKRKHKVTVFVVVVIGVYLALWLPFWCTELYYAFWTEGSFKTKYIMYTVTGFMSYTHSVINPLLYAFINDSFKAGFSELFLCGRASAYSFGSYGSGRNGSGPKARKQLEVEEGTETLNTPMGTPKANARICI